MSEQLEYIEDYFEKRLSDPQKREFEERCIHDKDFADEVAFYISARDAMRETLLEEKIREWSEDRDKDSAIAATTPVRKMSFRKWVPYAAAACLVLGVIGYFLYLPESPRNLAHQYVQQNYTELSQSMTGSSDSLELGIAAYNKKDYNTALSFFQKFYESHPENSDAKKYIGLSYLMLKDFDDALVHFEELAAKKGLQSNPGLFLKAVTLLERNQPGDNEAAKNLLKQVDNQQLEGSDEARRWLNK